MHSSEYMFFLFWNSYSYSNNIQDLQSTRDLCARISCCSVENQTCVLSNLTARWRDMLQLHVCGRRRFQLQLRKFSCICRWAAANNVHKQIPLRRYKSNCQIELGGDRCRQWAWSWPWLSLLVEK